MLLVVAATQFELHPLLAASNAIEEWPSRLWKGRIESTDICFLVTGPGAAATGYWMGRTLATLLPARVLNIGVCGSFISQLAIGDVVEIAQDTFADLGALDANGYFLDLQQLGMPLDINNGNIIYNQLDNPAPLNCGFPIVKGITVETVSGNSTEIEKIFLRLNPEVETMEGAAFFLSCRLANVPFGAIRAISNYVEPRNKANWNIPLAIEQLGKSALQIIRKWV